MPADQDFLTIDATNPAAESPTSAPCCRWRQTFQVPLLVFAAAGLGFSGQQMWQNGGDFASLLSGDRAGSCAYGSAADSGGCCPQLQSCASENIAENIAESEMPLADDTAVSALDPLNLDNNAGRGTF